MHAKSHSTAKRPLPFMNPAARKISFNKLAPKGPINSGLNPDSFPETDHTSLFHDISAIQRKQSSGMSLENETTVRQSIEKMINSNEKIVDFIEDSNTVLVFKDHHISTGGVDIFGTRFIIYQRSNEERGRIMIKSSSHELSENEEGNQFTFHQCSFYLCNTLEPEQETPGSTNPVWINVKTEDKLTFRDCAFISMNLCSVQRHSRVFTDTFSKLNLTLEHCFFRGMTSVLGANFPVKNLLVSHCTFENIESECFMINQPHHLRICDSIFLNCQAAVVSIKYFEDDTTMCYMTPKERKTSTFATTMKSDHFQSVVGFPHPERHPGRRQQHPQVVPPARPLCLQRRQNPRSEAVHQEVYYD